MYDRDTCPAASATFSTFSSSGASVLVQSPNAGGTASSLAAAARTSPDPTSDVTYSTTAAATSPATAIPITSQRRMKTARL